MLAAAVVLAGLACAAPVREGASPIPFQADLAATLRSAQAEGRLVVVFFSDPHCAWCQKQAATTFTDRGVLSLADQFLWVKVNLRTSPELAMALGVSGVPHVALLTGEGALVDSWTGYMPPAQMVRFLRASVGRTEPDPNQRAEAEELIAAMKTALPAAKGDQPCPELRAVVERLADPQRAGRRQLLEAVRQAGPAAWARLCAMMADERLALRAAAAAALAEATGQDLPFDPFAEKALRVRQIAAWDKWIQENRNAPATRPAGPADPPARQANP